MHSLALAKLGAPGQTTRMLEHIQIKIIRLARLAKLLRIFRFSKFMAAIESSVSINYSILQLSQHICVIAISAHWTACSCLLFTRVEVCRFIRVAF